jgi:2-haloacid dehalogenase
MSVITRAFIFDVFGTCVDWRSSVARDVAAALPGVDAFAFADAWRGEYQPAMARIRSGDRGYVPLDVLHRENLDVVSDRFNVTPPDPDWLTRTWERLDPWPDVAPGLTTLKRHGLIAPCSNGSVALMVRLARYGGLPWDTIVGADVARDYKPQSGVYLASARALGLDPAAVTMVAAHNDDLAAAKDAGLGTGFVPRPMEHGAGGASEVEPTGDWDWVAEDFLALADRIAS